ATARLYRVRSRAVRLLHSRDANGRCEAARGTASARPRDGAGCAFRQYLPLHWLPQDPRRRARCSSTSGEQRASRAPRGESRMSGFIGASIRRPDAFGKVTGATQYPADLIRPTMLQLQVVFAHRPSARIHAIDASAALAHPGVVAVLTAADVPYNGYGLI